MRSPHHYNFTSQSGVTLTELLIVIVIISVVATLALMNRGKANEVFQRQNIATNLKVAFERARFDSVKRRATGGNVAKVVVNTGSFVLWTDVDADGTPESTEVTSTDFSGQNIVIAGYGSLTLPFTVYYNYRGEAVDSSNNSVSPIFRVCQISCASPTSDNSNIVLVTPTGTVNMLAGNASIPTFNAPGVTSVPTGTGIKPLVTVP